MGRLWGRAREKRVREGSGLIVNQIESLGLAHKMAPMTKILQTLLRRCEASSLRTALGTHQSSVADCVTIAVWAKSGHVDVLA